MDGPAGPVASAGPCSPRGQAGPISPVSPLEPAGPAGACGPAGPRGPLGQTPMQVPFGRPIPVPLADVLSSLLDETQERSSLIFMRSDIPRAYTLCNRIVDNSKIDPMKDIIIIR
ncbi:MAG: hypothetical protein WCF07_12415 [Nitrososphaeraceae archaeon]